MIKSKTFITFETSETGSIDYTKLLEKSNTTFYLNVSESKATFKWEGEIIPSSGSFSITKEGPYTYEEIYNIFTGSEWVWPEEEI